MYMNMINVNIWRLRAQRNLVVKQHITNLRSLNKSQLHVNIHRQNFETRNSHIVNAAILEQ